LDYPTTMVKAILYDRLGYVTGEPLVPIEPSPQIVIWGEETFMAKCPTEEGRPQYQWVDHYVIAETRENTRFG